MTLKSRETPRLQPSVRVPAAGTRPVLARVVTLHLEGKLAEALQVIVEAPENIQTEPDLLAAKAHIFFELDQLEAAAEVYTRLAEADPSHAAGAFNLGVCLERLGRWTEAGVQFERALKLQPSRVETRLGLAICLLHQERAEEALAELDQFLAQQPDHETGLFARGVALQLLKRLDEARQAYEKVLA